MLAECQNVRPLPLSISLLLAINNSPHRRPKELFGVSGFTVGAEYRHKVMFLLINSNSIKVVNQEELQ